MRAIKIAPGEMPQPVEINPGLAALQEMVGGFIEDVAPRAEGWTGYGNEEAKIYNLPLNPMANFLMFELGGHNLSDILRGTVVVVGLGEDGNSCDVPEHIFPAMMQLIAEADER